jgi:hypothetical protein
MQNPRAIGAGIFFDAPCQPSASLKGVRKLGFISLVEHEFSLR